MALRIRQAQGESTADQFLELISNPFQSQLQSNSIYASIIWAFVVSGLLFVAFVFFRPKNTAIYARRAKYADEKHAPPTVGKGLFDFVRPVWRTQEDELVERIGVDAVILLRFIRMVRNIFMCCTVFGIAVLVPLNLLGGGEFYRRFNTIATLIRLTPQYVFGQKMWAYVVLAYVFQAIVCIFIFLNYRSVLRLRRAYFNSNEYRLSLHSRTLLARHIPSSLRSDAGVAELVTSVKETGEVPRAAVARNVKGLPDMIEEHEKTILKLEAVLSKYLQNPNRLPQHRPTCKPFKKDRGSHPEKVDAIDYLSIRARRLEVEIKAVRERLEQRNAMSYGFASYTHIEDAHAVAYAARKGGPKGTDITLAPKPHDIIWRNLTVSRAVRRNKQFWNGLWMILLTIAYIPLNVLSAVFLSNFSHLGLFWSGFQENLNANPVGWGIAQGIVAPLFQFLIFMALPPIFRRLYNRAGDVSKTARERHVSTRLYAFFVFNNLFVFSLFGSAAQFLAAVIEAKDQNVWDAIRNAHPFTNFVAGLCNVSTFWLTYQMQQNLGAAIDIAQLWPLVLRWFNRKFSSPTPRQVIQFSAPQPFDYASYYNTYLFISTVGLCFGTLQPIILPITAFYLTIELYFKRYILQYICFTKNESGGLFWRTLINRLIFAILLANGFVALVVGAQGVGADQLIGNYAANAGMLYAMIPLPILLFAFKFYLAHTFDTQMRYFSTGSTLSSDVEQNTSSEPKRPAKKDRIAVKFGHPALYKRLLAPMVHAKSEHLLTSLLSEHSHSGQGTHGFRHTDSFGYSDVYVGESSAEQPSTSTVPFEFVHEADLDFEHFKRRADFRASFGGDGELYGRPEDAMTSSRPGTPSTLAITLAGVDEGNEKGPENENDRESGYFAASTTRRGGAESPLLRRDGERDGDTSYRGLVTPEIGEMGLPTPSLEREDILRAGDRAVRRKPI